MMMVVVKLWTSSHRVRSSPQLLPDLLQPVLELQTQAEQQTADPGPHAGLLVLVFVLVLLDLQLPFPT